MRLVTVAMIAVLAAGCGVSGHYTDSGTCKGFRTNPELCKRAAANAAAIGRVHVGQSITDVRAAMGKDAERRTADGSSEAWGFITDYDAEMGTWVYFENGRVARIAQQPWNMD